MPHHLSGSGYAICKHARISYILHKHGTERTDDYYYSVVMQHGHTLAEQIMVLTVVGVLAGVGAPHLRQVRDTLAVEQAARQIAVAHQRARITAIVRNRAMVLTLSGDSITLRVKKDATLLWREPGPSAAGVIFTAPPRQVTFSAVGLATGAANYTYTVTRGDARRSVIVSRLGRVRTTS
jgi:Tfp pilus assembly protein FimT